MIKLIAILLYICIFLIISMWISLGGQIINMKKDLSNIKSAVDYTSDAVRDHYVWLRDHIDDVNKHLTTEIACLATKNNEDIKRVKEGFQKYDVFKFGDVTYFIYEVEKFDNGKIIYRCQSNEGIGCSFSDYEMNYAKFIRSASPWHEEEKGD